MFLRSNLGGLGSSNLSSMWIFFFGTGPNHYTRPTWRIISVGKWLVTPIYKPWKGRLEGKQPYLGDLSTMVINHVLIGIILQAELTWNPKMEVWFKWFSSIRWCLMMFRFQPLIFRGAKPHKTSNSLHQYTSPALGIIWEPPIRGVWTCIVRAPRSPRNSNFWRG